MKKVLWGLVVLCLVGVVVGVYADTEVSRVNKVFDKVSFLKLDIVGWMLSVGLTILLKRKSKKFLIFVDIITEAVKYVDKKIYDIVPKEYEDNLLMRPKKVIEKELLRRDPGLKKMVDKVLLKKGELGQKKKERKPFSPHGK